MFQHDPFLDDLLHRPMQMAMNEDDEYDEYDEDEDDDDLFGDDVLQALADERSAEEQDASDFAASLRGEETAVPDQGPEPPPEQTKVFTQPGIRRNLIAYGVLTIVGFLPFVMLLLFGAAAQGLSTVMVIFSAALLLGLAFSVYNLVYYFQHGYDYTVSFNVRTFFRFWPEVLAISVVLLGVSLFNLNGLSSGKPLTLSGKAIPAPMSQMQENEEEVVFSSFKVAQQNSQKKPAVKTTPKSAAPAKTMPKQPMTMEDHVQNMGSVAGGVVGAVGARDSQGYDRYLKEPVTGAAVGVIGSAQLPESVMPQNAAQQAKVLSSDNAMINTFFMGGSLCAALGYAFIVGLAGAIFGGLRKFDTPFSQKTVELINIETGEITSDKQPIAPIMKPINFISRVFIGLFYGSTLGFILGVAVILPLFLFFRQGLLNPMTAPLLQSLGLSTVPDLAFTHAVTVGGLFIPLVIIVVAKLSPQGMSVSEELMRQFYQIKPQGRFVPADQVMGGLTNPTAINFGLDGALMIPDDELETELANTRLMDELAMGEDNLTAEIIEEFGRDFESVFGIDTRELMTQPGQRQGVVDRRKLSSALDESFGELGNVPVEISAELGQASLPITEWLNLREGTLVLLDKPANEEIDILFNGVRKGKGKLVVSEEALAVKVSNTYFQNGNGNGLLI